MAQHSDIEWTDATWTVVQGCDYESPGCTHCYVPRVLHRLAANPNPKISAPMQGLTRKTDKGDIVFTGKVALREDRLTWPLEWKKPSRIFVPSHGDPFHPAVPDEFIDKLFAVMALADHHTLQVLSKRSERMRRYFNDKNVEQRIFKAAQEIAVNIGEDISHPYWDTWWTWPLVNVWLGVSVEDQKRADERIPHLLETPADVRFLSCEPLLGPVDLESAWHGENALDSECWGECAWCANGHPPLHNCQNNRQSEAVWNKGRSGIDWVICGGESGRKARPMHPDWARSLRDQCTAAGVPFFFKQWGEWAPVEDYASEQMESDEIEGKYEHFDDQSFRRVGKKDAGRLLDGRTWDEMPGAGL